MGTESQRSPTRRAVLGAAGAGIAGVGLGAAGMRYLDQNSAPSPEAAPASAAERAYPFYGDHQAGIVTPMQDRLHFATFDAITLAGTS